MAQKTSSRIIRASELGQYAFCARAWWLGSVQGLPSTLGKRIAEGETAHRQHGRSVRSAVLLTRLAYVLLALAALAALVALLRPIGV